MNALDAALYTTLTAGLGGTAVYNQVVPPGAAYPCLVYGLSGGGDANETPLRRKDVLYTVKAISKVSIAEAGAIDAQADALLHNQTLSVAGWANFWTAREGDIAYAEVTDRGENYYHSGGVYRIRLSQEL